MHTSLSDHLRTTQVEVDSITVVLRQQSRLKEHLWIIGTKLEKTQHKDLLVVTILMSSSTLLVMATQVNQHLDPHLCDERPVLFAHLIVEVVSPVVGVPNKHLSMQHGGVAELSAMPATQQAPGQLTLVHHGRHHKASFFQGLPPELKTLELGHHSGLHL